MARRLAPAFSKGTQRTQGRNMGDDARCVRAATLLEHLSIAPDRTRNRRDSAIPFIDIEARPRRCRLEKRRRATRQR